jgi:hypothetical protein
MRWPQSGAQDGDGLQVKRLGLVVSSLRDGSEGQAFQTAPQELVLWPQQGRFVAGDHVQSLGFGVVGPLISVGRCREMSLAPGFDFRSRHRIVPSPRQEQGEPRDSLRIVKVPSPLSAFPQDRRARHDNALGLCLRSWL